MLRAAMELPLIWIIARRELRDALRNKWLAFYALGFAALSVALSGASLANSGYAGLGGFGRTAASLVNALLLFVPLLGLNAGATAITRERERGTLLYLLAQPVNRAEVFFGYALGTALAVISAILIGYGLAGVVLSLGAGGDPGIFLELAMYTALLALVAVAMGLVVGAVARKTATATSAALMLWLALVFFSDLGMIGATLAFRPTTETLFALLVANPLQTFKLAAIFSLRATLDTLGAVGQYAFYEFGEGLPALLIGVLTTWLLALVAAAFALFAKRGDA